MTGGRSGPCRSFTKAHAVSELTFSVSQMSLPNLGAISATRVRAEGFSDGGIRRRATAVISRVRWEVRGT
jgi:hypothetical protein